MTFTDAAAQSRTFTRAWGDLMDGFRKRELWLHLGWQDIKQKYRRSVLGPFWITIATGTTAVAMGGLYSKLFHLELSEHLPYVTLGLIIWNMINASILEGADVFIANEGLIKQLPTPLSVHVYRLVWRQMILFAHNIVIYVVIAIIFPKPWSLADLTVIPALLLIMLNCVWVSFCFGILATRYRDIGPLLFSIVQLLFFMTPIIWNADTLRQQGASKWAKIIELNPLLHYLDILRAPLLGAHQELRHWIVVVALTMIGWLVAALALRQYRARVPYWV
ncbi:MAG TPA: ABC transporter permease [Mycobacterium sp.]